MIPVYRLLFTVLSLFAIFSVYAQHKADLAYKTLLRESLGNQIALDLIARNAFEAQAQAQFKELAEKYNASVARACAMDNIPLDRCLFDTKSRWVVSKAKAEKSAAPTKKP